jgi:hypothetical protein
MPCRLSHGRIPHHEKLTGYPVTRIFKGTANDSPSPWGEGRVEGGC